ncbi:MAG: ribosome small subunit-dependent GTPase A [Parvularculaceae bacterium]
MTTSLSAPASTTPLNLADLGWGPFFQSQLDEEAPPAWTPVRVMAVHKNALDVAGPDFSGRIPPISDENDDEGAATVGDWLLADRTAKRARRLLSRRSLFKRRAPGTARRIQLIAANVDTLFIVSSCNQDFNIARLERYLALAREAEATPVVVLTKADLADAPADYARRTAKLLPGLFVETLNALSADEVSRLEPWCGCGQTVALLGSSGGGKTTLVNAMTGSSRLATQAAREDDDKGRHTTTGRALHRLPAGGWLLDTPGMRELQLVDVKSGIDDVFADLVALGRQCRFSDCSHQGEPGCAIAAAAETGEIDGERLKRWRKLAAEEAFNASSLAERRASEKRFGRLVKGVMAEKRRRRDM